VQSIRATAAQFLGVPPNKVCDLLRNVWSTSKGNEPLSDQEMFMGMSLIARYGLDPIAREIYVTRDNKGRLMTIIGIDGWVKILHRTDDYDGHVVTMNFSEDGKQLLSVETTIHSKTRKYPTTYVGFMFEYAKLGGFMMEKIPWHMLRVFSLHHAARLFTPVGGSVVTEDEARWMQAYDAAEHQAPAVPPAEKKSQRAADEMKRRKAEQQQAETPTSSEASETPSPVNPDADPPEEDFIQEASNYMDVIDDPGSTPLALAKVRANIVSNKRLPKDTQERLLAKCDKAIKGKK
jgi:hypothetical protein